MGLSATEAITVFYTQVAMQRGLPFEVRLPNSETVEVLRQAQTGTDLVEHQTLEQLRSKA